VFTQRPGGALTPVEKELVEHVSRGELLDLRADGEVIDEAVMRSWGDERTCRATVIRDILRGKLVFGVDPHGLRLRGARIIGRIDLENLRTEVNFELTDCLLGEGIVIRDAHLTTVGLAGCQLEHRTKPPLEAARLTCSVLSLSGVKMIGHVDVGTVHLAGAHIGGTLSCVGAVLRNDSGPALMADGMQVGQGTYLSGGFTATGAGADGAVRLTAAHIGLFLDCAGAVLRNDSGPALSADGMHVGQAVFFRNGFTATGAGAGGAVRLTAAHIGSNLECAGAALRNDSGPALSADALKVGQGMYFSRGFTATGAGDGGAVRLPGAHVGGDLDCSGAVLCNDFGPALRADDLQVDKSMLLRDGFNAAGSGPGGAVHIPGVHIGGKLDCTGAIMRNDSGSALVAHGLHVARDMIIWNGFNAVAGGVGVAVSLRGARVDGKLVFDPELEHLRDPQYRLDVDGLIYTGVPGLISARDWLGLLRDGTPGYAAQPYQQMAAGYRAIGNERQTRLTLMAQRDHELARTLPRWPERLWGKITKVTLGYGYQPWRALLFLAGVVVSSCMLALTLGLHGALAQTGRTATPGRPCTVLQQVSVGLDLNLPVGTSLARADCDLTKESASATADWLTIAVWALRLLAWVFAALFIAGFTSAVRKT
jgi:hypothetical protein